MRSRLASVVLFALCAALLPATPAFALPPPNDNFENAQAIAGDQGQVPVEFDQATLQPGEPKYPGQTPTSGHRSVWFRWTAPATAWYRFQTTPNDWDCLSTAPVYQGSTLQTLDRRSHHSANDNWGDLDHSFLRAVEGQTYSIASAAVCDGDDYLQFLSWERRGPLILEVVRGDGTPAADVRVHSCEPLTYASKKVCSDEFGGVTNDGGRVYFSILGRYNRVWRFELIPRSNNLAPRDAAVQVPPETRNAVFAQRQLKAAPTQDLDRDGRGDVVSGVPLADRGAVNAGAVVIRFGDGRLRVLDEASATIPSSARRGEQFGSSVSAGDMDNDGWPDLIIGAPGEVVGRLRPGAVFVVFGSSRGLGNGRPTWLRHQNLAGVAGRAANGDRFGAVVAPSRLSFLTNVLVGVPGKDSGGVTNSGAVVRFSIPWRGDWADPLPSVVYHQGTPGVHGANAAGDRFGAALAHGGFAMGESSHSASASLAIGVPGKDVGGLPDAGAVVVLRGILRKGQYKESGNPLIHQNSAVVPGARARGGNQFGATLVGFRAHVPVQFDGVDSRSTPDWLAVGAPGDGGGSVSVLRAGTRQPQVFSPATHNRVLVQGDGVVAGADEPGDRFGAALAVGDLDDDQYPDLIVGAPGEEVSGRTNAGGATVMYGRLTQSVDELMWDVRGSVVVRPGDGGVPGGPTAGTQFGIGVASIDVSGDGYPDAVAGAPGHDATVRNGGAVFAAHRGPFALRGGRMMTWSNARAGDGFGTVLAAPHLPFDMG